MNESSIDWEVKPRAKKPQIKTCLTTDPVDKGKQNKATWQQESARTCYDKKSEIEDRSEELRLD
jgi:hypothetical protein